MKNISPISIGSIITFSITAIFLLSFVTYGAWQEPTVTAPNGNVGAPINISDKLQAKAGPLIVNNTVPGASIGFALPSGNALFGALTPSVTLTAPNGESNGNLEVNDIFVRSTGSWLGQSVKTLSSFNCLAGVNASKTCDTGLSSSTNFCAISHIENGGCDSGFGGAVVSENGTWKVKVVAYGDCNINGLVVASCFPF